MKPLEIILQLIFYFHSASAHNILRLDGTRLAKFILRHTDKVHVTSHYKEFKIVDEAACVDRCVTETPCKSVNFYVNDTAVEESQCQLVAEDIDDVSEYVERSGWRHLDTGKTVLTRLKHPNGFCWAPKQGGCDFSSSIVELHPLASDKCQSISAYYEFDRSWAGIIVHVCSGKVLCPVSDSLGSLVRLVNVEDCPYCDMSFDKRKKFRRNPAGYLEWSANLCVGPYTKNVATGYDMILTSSCTDDNSALMTFDFDKGPILVAIFKSMGTRSFDDFEAAIRSKQSNPDSIVYLDVFMYRSQAWNYFSMKMESVFQAPATGEFRFYLMANAFSKMYMGSDEKANSKTYCCGSPFNGSLDENLACTRFLVKGAKYHIELLTYDGAGEDWQYIFVRKPGEENKIPIDFEDLELPK